MKGHGNIYLVISEEQRLGKIGYCSDDPEQRLFSMQTGNPARLRLVSHIPGTRRQEGMIHAALADLRHVGEWFKDPFTLAIVFDVLHNAAMTDDDQLEEMTDAALAVAIKDALAEAIYGVA